MTPEQIDALLEALCGPTHLILGLDEKRVLVAEHFQRWAQPIGYVAALKIADDVFDSYKKDNLKWWKRMDGTPILNDVSVRMAKAFGEIISTAPPEPKPAQDGATYWLGEDNVVRVKP